MASDGCVCRDFVTLLKRLSERPVQGAVGRDRQLGAVLVRNPLATVGERQRNVVDHRVSGLDSPVIRDSGDGGLHLHNGCLALREEPVVEVIVDVLLSLGRLLRLLELPHPGVVTGLADLDVSASLHIAHLIGGHRSSSSDGRVLRRDLRRLLRGVVGAVQGALEGHLNRLTVGFHPGIADRLIKTNGEVIDRG